MKKLWIIALSALLLGVAPTVAETPAIESIEVETTAVTLSFSGNSVHVSNAEGKTLEVYNLTGVKVFSTKIEDSEAQIPLNLTKGFYMIKVGKVVRKVTIR